SKRKQPPSRLYSLKKRAESGALFFWRKLLPASEQRYDFNPSCCASLDFSLALDRPFAQFGLFWRYHRCSKLLALESNPTHLQEIAESLPSLRAVPAHGSQPETSIAMPTR